MIEPVEVEGFSQWQQSLDRFSSQADEKIARMLAMAAETVADDAQRLVPRGSSGAARASLKVVGPLVTAGGPKVPYFGWLEFGGRVGRRGSVRRTFVPGGRYIWPQWMRQRTDILTAMENGLTDLARESGL
jgi:hypothetical protein